MWSAALWCDEVTQSMPDLFILIRDLLHIWNSTVVKSFATGTCALEPITSSLVSSAGTCLRMLPTHHLGIFPHACLWLDYQRALVEKMKVSLQKVVQATPVVSQGASCVCLPSVCVCASAQFVSCGGQILATLPEECLKDGQGGQCGLASSLQENILH